MHVTCTCILHIHVLHVAYRMPYPCMYMCIEEFHLHFDPHTPPPPPPRWLVHTVLDSHEQPPVFDPVLTLATREWGGCEGGEGVKGGGVRGLTTSSCCHVIAE